MSNENDVKIGSGKSPEGAAVLFYECDRPGTIGARGAQGFVIEVRDAATGKRITHSDTIKGLESAGFVLDAEGAAPVVPPDASKLRKDVPLTVEENELIAIFVGQLDAEQKKDLDALMDDYGAKPYRPVSEILAELEGFFPLTSAPGTQPTRVPVAAAPSPALSIEEQLG